jgi:plasmid stabilization system protein ParE
MPHLIFTKDALGDLVRLSAFLAAKNEAAARRASAAIIAALQSVTRMPEGYRPCEGRPHEREAVIKFGAYGYVARYRYERGGDVHVLHVWHGREDRGLE